MVNDPDPVSRAQSAPERADCRCRGDFHRDRCPAYLANCEGFERMNARMRAERDERAAAQHGRELTLSNVDQMHRAARLLAEVGEVDLADAVRAVATRLATAVATEAEAAREETRRG